MWHQVALNWNLQKGFLVLVGIRSVEQVGNHVTHAFLNSRYSVPQFHHELRASTISFYFSPLSYLEFEAVQTLSTINAE